MKKFLTLLVVATAINASAPLTSTYAAPTKIAFPKDRTYEQGYEFGQSRMESCSITTQADWQDARNTAKQRSDYYYSIGNLSEGAYYRGYYDGLGSTFAYYC